jgi:ribosome-associated protein
MDIRKIKAAVIDALEEIKAKNIVMLNVSKLTSLFDYLVVASGDSNRQTRALADNVKERLKAAGATIYGTEGEESGEWVLVDLGDIVVHVMVPATRDYYRLEDLWREGKLEFPKPEAKKAASGKAAPAKAEKAKAAGAKPKTGTKVKPGSKVKPGTRAKAGTKVKSGARVKTAGKTKAGATVKVGTRAKTGNSKTKAGSRTAAGTTVKAASKIKTGSGTAATARTKPATTAARRKKAV